MPPWALDALLTVLAVADAWLSSVDFLQGYLALGGALWGSLAALALLFRRRVPVLVFAVTFVMMALSPVDSVTAVLVALFTLAERFGNRWALGASAALYAVAANWTEYHGPAEDLDQIYNTVISSGTAFTAIFLGQLVKTRRELARNMAELREAQEHERELHAQAVLARERAQLAREMHDVVSHQVSLIAVGAGALQVGADSSETREAARTIRKLSVTTLEELRHMVTLLRAAGGTDSGTTPQPTREQLPDLVAGSGLDARLVGGVPADAGAAVQRAVYRIVQESLTNVRKHAPGATATVEIHGSDQALTVTVTNTAPTRPALRLPGSGLGLIGLRERTENLHGTLTCGTTPDGGYRVRATLPASGR
ncbi:histidine kinase [Kitasatospora sp. NPDC093806]|uniref:sensor histidine kinase n=1 Tax=Kitasatospora sp. NPDC093806 TaxID=3155075 RepID=UPI003422DD4B